MAFLRLSWRVPELRLRAAETEEEDDADDRGSLHPLEHLWWCASDCALVFIRRRNKGKVQTECGNPRPRCNYILCYGNTVMPTHSVHYDRKTGHNLLPTEFPTGT